MRQLVSQFILDKYVSAEHRGGVAAATIFVDVSGFSKMTDQLAHHGDHGAEVLADVMRALFEPLVQAVYLQGGFVLGYAGDAFTAIFPEEKKRHPAVLRALACASSMQEHVRSHARIATEFGEFPVFIKAGIGSGEIRWLIIRSATGQRATYCVRGSSVDGAVAAEECALPGSIVLDPAAYRLLASGVDVSSVNGYFQLEAIRVTLPPGGELSSPASLPKQISLFCPDSVLRESLTGEFREVVNLFIDIPLDPTDEAFVTPFMEGVFAMQERYGGFFLRPELGDKGFTILMVWGAPVAHENDIERALTFILELAERTGIAFRAGITYHQAYAGFIGGALREDYTAYGPGVNLASRMMEMAGPGEVWMDEQICKRASRLFNSKELGEFSFKGFANKSKAFVLQGRRKLVELAYHGDLVGRDPELGQLVEFLEPLRQGHSPGVMLVEGEAGIGKSRLVRSLQALPALQESPLQWVVCEADEILRQPFDPFRDWLAEYFHISSDLPAEEGLRVLDEQLTGLSLACPDAQLGAELDRTAPFLAALLNFEPSSSLYAELDAKGRYDNTLIALSVLFRLLSLQKPLVLLMEDLQWLDEDSRAFLTYFVRVLRRSSEAEYPIALLLTSRPGQQIHDLTEIAPVRILELDVLPAGGLASLGREQLGGELDPGLARMLEQRSGGNPFFAEQLLKYLQENHLLERDAQGRFRAAAGAGNSVPTDVRALLIARLDRLGRDVREVVQTASILGREFELRVLLSILRNDPDVPRKVGGAEQADIWFPMSEILYIFRHELLRQAAYSMQLVSRQRQLHALAVSALQELYAGELDPHLGELAYHAEHANMPQAARTYLLQAGKAAAGAYQNSQAIDYFTRALPFLSERDLAGRFDLLRQRAELYSRIGNRTGQREDLDAMQRLVELEGSDARQARLLGMRAYYSYVTGSQPEAESFASSAVSLAKNCGEIDIALEAYNVWAVALMRQGHIEQAREVGSEGLVLARIHGKRSQEGSALNSLAMIEVEAENAIAGRGLLERALRVAQEIHDRVLESKVLTNLGNVAGFLSGDYAGARAAYEQAYALQHELGDRYAEGVVVGNLGWVSGMQGDFDAARSYLAQAIAIAREIGNPHQEAYSLINLSAVAAIQSDAGAAAGSARRALDLTRQIHDRTGESWALLNLGHAHLIAEQFEQARQAYEECRKIRLELNQPGFEMEPVAGLIQAALRLNDLSAAASWTDQVVSYLDAGGGLEGAEEPLRVYYACYEALLKMKNPRSSDLLQKAKQLLEAQVSKFSDEAARQAFVNSVPWRRSIRDAVLPDA